MGWCAAARHELLLQSQIWLISYSMSWSVLFHSYLPTSIYFFLFIKERYHFKVLECKCCGYDLCYNSYKAEICLAAGPTLWAAVIKNYSTPSDQYIFEVINYLEIYLPCHLLWNDKMDYYTLSHWKYHFDCPTLCFFAILTELPIRLLSSWNNLNK